MIVNCDGATSGKTVLYVKLSSHPHLALPGSRWAPNVRDYVRQTARDPDLRFDQHKAGYKASSAVRRFGVRLMPELTAHLTPILGWEALEIEAALAEAFRQADVPWVEGGH